MKTYKELKEEQELYELNILRTGSALLFATKVREAGRKTETHIRNAVGNFSKAKRQDEIEKKMDALLDGLLQLSQAQYQQRIMLGNMTGINVSNSVFNQRTKKQLLKLMKRR